MSWETSVRLNDTIRVHILAENGIGDQPLNQGVHGRLVPHVPGVDRRPRRDVDALAGQSLDEARRHSALEGEAQYMRRP